MVPTDWNRRRLRTLPQNILVQLAPYRIRYPLNVRSNIPYPLRWLVCWRSTHLGFFAGVLLWVLKHEFSGSYLWIYNMFGPNSGWKRLVPINGSTEIIALVHVNRRSVLRIHKPSTTYHNRGKGCSVAEHEFHCRSICWSQYLSSMECSQLFSPPRFLPSNTQF